MTTYELLKDAADFLKKSGETETPRLDAEVLLGFCLNCDRLNLILNAKKSVPDDVWERFLACLRRRYNGEPIAYILGYREFMSLKFNVTEGVLIPRPDTEVLAEFAIDAAKKIENPVISDLCTGSGALAVSVAKYVSSAFVYAVDFSDICVKTAQKNAVENGVLNRIKIIKQDILKDFSFDTKVDLLISNPPYIKTKVIDTLSKSVKDYEPKTALDGGEDGLIFYRRIIEIAPLLLKSGGTLAMEIGYDQFDELKTLLQNSRNFKNISFLKDLAGIKRVICAELLK